MNILLSECFWKIKYEITEKKIPSWMFLSFIKLLFKSKQESWNFELGTILN